MLQGLDQHVPIPEYIENLRKILSALTDEDSPYAVSETQGLNIVVITPPALYPPMMDGDGAKNRTAEHTLKYVEAAVSVGKEWKAKESPKGSWKIATINAFDAMTEKANGSEQTLKSFFKYVHVGEEADSQRRFTPNDRGLRCRLGRIQEARKDGVPRPWLGLGGSYGSADEGARLECGIWKGSQTSRGRYEITANTSMIVS